MVFFVLILRYIKKWPLTKAAGWWMAESDDFKRGYWSRVEIPTRMQIFFFANFCIQIDQYEFIQLYKLYSTNSYNYTNCIVQIHTIRTFFIQIVYYEFIQQREGEARAARAQREPRGRSPSTPPAPTRPHPAAPPTLGYTRLPRPLGYTRLPRH